jgi:outer membrane protein OmpA-like peptidoglycan-associated protein
MGYRDPFDYRNPACFSSDTSTPDCRSILPFNYDSLPAIVDDGMESSLDMVATRQVYFPDVNFDFDKRQLNDLGTGRARQIAQLLEQEPGLRIVLEGHTDFIGSEGYNEKLGLDRAEAVRQQLVGLGVASDRVSTVTFGKTKPVFADETDWARAVNRRVQIQLDDGSDLME